MQTLTFHKLCKDNQKEMIGEVEKIRRKVLFVFWFNLVHDELPALRKAKHFYMRNRLIAFHRFAVENRSKRARRTLLNQLSAEHFAYMLKKRGVMQWRKSAVKGAYISSKVGHMRLFRLRKLFNGWYDSKERRMDGKCRHVM